MINLTDSDKELIKNLEYPKLVNLSIGQFYIKRINPERGLKELLGKEVATQMGLITPNCQIIIIDGWEYLLSEDLNDYGKFVNAEDMEIGEGIEDYCSLSEAKVILDKYCIGNEVNNLIKIYIFDIIFKHFDRNTRNWGLIIISPDNIPKLVVLDNEYLLVENERPEKLKLYFKSTLPSSLEEDFTCFLREGNPEDIQIFEYYFNLYTPKFIENLIEQIIKRNNLDVENKEEIISDYKLHYLRLKQLFVREYKEKSGRNF